MNATRARTAAFFVQYLVLLVAALVWVNSDVGRQRVGPHLTQFYALIGAAFCWLCSRTYLLLRGLVPTEWKHWGAAVDLVIISGAVYLTGGINSEAALLYFLPIATFSIQRLPRATVAVSLASAVLYLAATWPSRVVPSYATAIIFRLVILLVTASLATYNAMTEQALIEEVGRLREEIALASYRSRLSQEMHDGIQHYLADIAVRLELARSLISRDPVGAARMAADQRFVVRQALGELRYLVRLLRSPAVEREGFVDALRHHLSLFSESSSVAAPLEIEGEAEPLPPEVAHAAFRIMQEALMNVEKHAKARQARVILRFAPCLFGCTIKDDGVGFDPSAAPEQPSVTGGFGLLGMQQRAESVGGQLRVVSSPGAGTEVTFTVAVGDLMGLPQDSMRGRT